MGFRDVVFNATFNNISVISWRSVLFGGGGGGPEYQENTTDLSQVTDKIISSTPRHERGSNSQL